MAAGIFRNRLTRSLSVSATRRVARTIVSRREGSLLFSCRRARYPQVAFANKDCTTAPRQSGKPRQPGPALLSPDRYAVGCTSQSAAEPRTKQFRIELVPSPRHPFQRLFPDICCGRPQPRLGSLGKCRRRRLCVVLVPLRIGPSERQFPGFQTELRRAFPNGQPLLRSFRALRPASTRVVFLTYAAFVRPDRRLRRTPNPGPGGSGDGKRQKRTPGTTEPDMRSGKTACDDGISCFSALTFRFRDSETPESARVLRCGRFVIKIPRFVEFAWQTRDFCIYLTSKRTKAHFCKIKITGNEKDSSDGYGRTFRLGSRLGPGQYLKTAILGVSTTC